jgi:UDP-glucose:(glucosyl)LPS alpha-1,2-glucosyltransferase
METSLTDMKPRGGTELILANLQAALPELTSQVQIIMSRPEQVELEDKPRILWLQDLPQDPASQCLRDPSYRTRFNAIVFASHWQQQMYNAYLGIPYDEGHVIRNGVPWMQPTFPKARVDGKLQFLYTSTPHRGLALLAAAADVLAKQRQDWTLHVYSSFNIYGWKGADDQYAPVYEQLRNNPCVVYHGTQPNSVVRQAALDAHVFVYPSIYVETSCMAIQEAMMAGCLAITTGLGALIETCGSWAWMMPYTEHHEKLASTTYELMNAALDTYDRPGFTGQLEAQSAYFQNFYSFESRLPQWRMLLERVIAQGAPEEKFIVG